MEGVGLGGFVVHVADLVGHSLQVVGGIGHLIGVFAKRDQHLALGLGGDALHSGGLGGGRAGQLAHVGGSGGDQLLVGDLQHGAGLDVEDLGVVLHLNLVAAEHLGLGQNAEFFHQFDVLLVLQGDHGVRGALAVGQAAALGLGFPGIAVAVAVEDHTAVGVQRLLDPGGGCALKVGSAGSLGHELLQRLGNGGVQDGVGVGQVLGRAGHTELKLVAGEGEGGGTVAVGGVLAELGQDVDAQIHLHLDGTGVGRIGADGVDDSLQLLAHEDGNNSRGCLVGAQAVVVARGSDGGAQQVGVLVNRLDNGGQEHHELQVFHRGIARIQQVLALGADGPVVVLAAAVHALKRLLVLQADQAVLAGDLLHHLHRQQVVVDGDIGGVVDGGQLMLAGGDLVVLGLGGHAQLPQLLVQVLHELGNDGAEGAEVVLLQLLALGRGRAEQCAAGQHQVKALVVVLFLDEEVLLLGADGGSHAGHVLAEQMQHLAGLVGDGLHRAQQRGLLVQCLAGVGAERGGDAQRVVLYESVAGGVPGGVAAGLSGGAQAAGGEGGSIRLALDELLTGELHDGGAIRLGADKAVVLLTGDAGQRLEPVGVMGGALLDCPALHHAGHDVGDLQVQGLALLDRRLQAFVGRAGQTLTHLMLVENFAAVKFHNGCCHTSYSFMYLITEKGRCENTFAAPLLLCLYYTLCIAKLQLAM